MNHTLSPLVQMQLMRPRQLEEALRAFPVVYVPFGLIEWHGRHLPLGTDSLKAHSILVECAARYGGAVYPPVYYPHARFVRGSDKLHPDEDQWKIVMLTALFSGIKAMGARVIIAVSGHNVPQQIAWFNKAFEPVVADGTVAAAGIWEVSLNESKDVNTDHAAKWETSDMMYSYPECVDLSELGDVPIADDMAPPDGIGGLDPRMHASPEVGRRKAELASSAIGEKARELLQSLPKDQRRFNLPSVLPPHWWAV